MCQLIVKREQKWAKNRSLRDTKTYCPLPSIICRHHGLCLVITLGLNEQIQGYQKSSSVQLYGSVISLFSLTTLPMFPLLQSLISLWNRNSETCETVIRRGEVSECIDYGNPDQGRAPFPHRNSYSWLFVHNILTD
ncbi:hypothetical protein J6590_075796 [Homalodisca vitripennis]|nr:hypothetical protein J6590_075796 [Homalodisca vitripennis]